MRKVEIKEEKENKSGSRSSRKGMMTSRNVKIAGRKCVVDWRTMRLVGLDWLVGQLLFGLQFVSYL